MSRLPQDMKRAFRLALTAWVAAIASTSVWAQGHAPALGLQHVFTFSAYGKGPLSAPDGVAVDPVRNEVYVADPATHEVVILNAKGSPAFRFQHWVRDPRGAGPLVQGEPCCALPGDKGTIFVTDRMSDQIDVTDFRGRKLRSLDLTALLGSAQKAAPRRMDRDPAGNLYVVEEMSRQVIVISPQGKVLRKLGGRGKQASQFEMIADVAVDAAGMTYVLDSEREPGVKVFDGNGAYVRGFGEHSDRPEGLHFPVAVATDHTGVVWIVDSFAHEVKAFTAAGDCLADFGHMGSGDGQFYFPSDVACSAGDELYVVERGGDRLQGFQIQRAPSTGAGAMP